MSVVLTDIKNKLGIITINSEKSLNALSLDIVTELKAVLEQWETDEQINCVFLQGAGEKAFCAGGDIRQVRAAIEDQKQIDPTIIPPLCVKYFITEYSLDYLIHRYPKPIVVWGDGIVMGGGLGLLAGASHRIVTERSLLAMPEVSIGLYPDVGASFFLNKMPSAYGLYLGLTGTRFDGSDALFLGIADHYIARDKKEEVITALSLLNLEKNAKEKISSSLQTLSTSANQLPTSQTQTHQSWIAQFEKIHSLQQFKDLIIPMAKEDEWVNAGYTFFKKGSPTSTHVIFKQLTESKNFTLEEVFQSELNLTCQFTVHPDFSEGVRALLIDKDQSPQWTPATSEEVTTDWVNSHFTPLWTKETHPFSNLK